MSLVKRSMSAFGQVGIIIGIALAFLFGLTGTVYLSLRSSEVKVPDVVGKDRLSAEDTLSDSGLNIRVRATRPSNDVKPDTVVMQVPHAGEVVKEGQTVAVDVSRAPKPGEPSVSFANNNDNNKPAENKPEEQKPEGNENANSNQAASKNDNQNSNQNQNKAKRNKNSNANSNSNRNSNNSNNGNNTNRNANGAAANNRNSNQPNRNANSNANRGSNSNNANRRPPATATPPATTPTPHRTP